MRLYWPLWLTWVPRPGKEDATHCDCLNSGTKALSDRDVLENSVLELFPHDKMKCKSAVFALGQPCLQPGWISGKGEGEIPQPSDCRSWGGVRSSSPKGWRHGTRVKELGLLLLPLLSSLPSSFFHLFFTNIKELSNFLFQLVAL